MLAATAAALSRSCSRSAMASRIAAAASSVLEQASLPSSGGERSAFAASFSSSSSYCSSSSSTAAAAAATFLQEQRGLGSCPRRSFSASSFASAARKKSGDGGEEEAAGRGRRGKGTGHGDDGSSSSGSAPSASGPEEDASWSNPMPSLEAIDDFLDEWGRLLDEGDAAGVLKLLEERTAAAPGLPPLDEVWASATAADDERAARRAHETAAQLEQASRRLRLVDAQGRSYATGRRKEAVARVWLRPAAASAPAPASEGGAVAAGRVWINGAPLDAAFPSAPTSRAADVLAPFVVTRTVGDFDVRATVAGGGPTGQAQAVRLGVARALQLWAPEARPALKAAGLLTRDSRSVERKKPGRAKARKAFQWVKR